MRESCLNCVRKHLSTARVFSILLKRKDYTLDILRELGQAKILLEEFSTGDYDMHFWYALGHMSVAEEIALRMDKIDLFSFIREERSKSMGEKEEEEYYIPDIIACIEAVVEEKISKIIKINRKELVACIQGHICEAMEESMKDFSGLYEDINDSYQSVMKKKSWDDIEFDNLIDIATDNAEATKYEKS